MFSTRDAAVRAVFKYFQNFPVAGNLFASWKRGRETARARISSRLCFTMEKEEIKSPPISIAPSHLLPLDTISVWDITCRNDLIDAGRLLLPYRVPTPTGQSAVIPLGFGGVDELAHGAVISVKLGRRDFEVLAAVVELPDKVHLARVGVYLAAHLHGFLQRGPDNRHLLRLADRRDWIATCKRKRQHTRVFGWTDDKNDEVFFRFFFPPPPPSSPLLIGGTSTAGLFRV